MKKSYLSELPPGIPKCYSLVAKTLSSETTLPVLEGINSFIDNEDKRVLLLHGDVGSGKTQTCIELVHHLTNEKQAEVIYISVGQNKHEKGNCLETFFKRHNITLEEQRQLKNDNNCVFIFDGYEQLGHLKNMYLANHLDQWPLAKIIITVRSGFLLGLDRYQVQFTPLSKTDLYFEQLDELQLSGFNSETLSIVRQQAKQRIDQSLWQQLSQSSWLDEWLAHPQRSQMILEVLTPHCDANKVQSKLIKALIKNVTEQIPGDDQANILELMRLLPDMLGPHTPVGYELAIDSYLFDTPQHPRWTECLAFDSPILLRGLLSQLLTINRHGNAEFVINGLKEALGSRPPRPRQLKIVENIAAKEVVDQTQESIPLFISRLIRSQLNTQNYVGNDSVLNLMADGILKGTPESDILKKHYTAIVTHDKIAKKYPQLKQASANCATILVRARKIFTPKDNLKGAHLEGADLSGGYFDRVLMSGAHMEGAVCVGTWFRHCQAMNASMTNVDLGEQILQKLEYPRLKRTHIWKKFRASGKQRRASEKVIARTDINRLFVELGGMVFIWDLARNHCISALICQPVVSTREQCRTFLHFELRPETAVPQLLSLLDFAIDRSGSTIVMGGFSHHLFVTRHAETCSNPELIFKGHTSYITSVAISGDGLNAYSGSHDGSVRIWKIDQPEPEYQKILWQHTRPIRWIKLLSSDQKLLVCDGAKIVLWDLRSNEADCSLKTNKVTQADHMFQPAEIVSRGVEWTGENFYDYFYTINTTPHASRYIQCVALDRTERYLVTCEVLRGIMPKTSVYVWSLLKNDIIKQFEINALTTEVCFNKTSDILFFSVQAQNNDSEFSVQAWEIMKGRKIYESNIYHSSIVTDLSIDEVNGDLIYVLNDSYNYEIRRLRTTTIESQVDTNLAFSNVDAMIPFDLSCKLLLLDGNNTISIDTSTMQVLSRSTIPVGLHLCNDDYSTQSISRDGQFLLCQNEGKSNFSVVNVTTGEVAFTHEPEDINSGVVEKICHGGDKMAFSGNDNIVRIGIKQAQKMYPLPEYDCAISAIAMSSDGHYLCLGCASGIIELWDCNTMRCILQDNKHTGRINKVSFSKDSMRFFTAGSDGKLGVGHTGKLTFILQARDHEAAIINVENFIYDRKIVVTTVDRNNVIITIDVKRNKYTYRHDREVSAMIYDNVNRQLLIGDVGGNIYHLNFINNHIRQLHIGTNVILGDLGDASASVGGGENTEFRAAYINDLYLINSSNTLIAICDHTTLVAIDLATGVKLFDNSIYSHMMGKINGSCFDQSDGTLMLATNGGFVLEHRNYMAQRSVVWVHDLANFNESETMLAAAISPCGNYLLISNRTPACLQLWDIQEKTLIQAFYGQICPARSVCFNADNSLIVAATLNGNCVIWDTATTEIVVECDSPLVAMNARFCEDESLVAIGGFGDTMLWQHQSGNVDTYAVHFSRHASIPHDNQYLLTSRANNIECYNFHTREFEPKVSVPSVINDYMYDQHPDAFIVLSNHTLYKYEMYRNHYILSFASTHPGKQLAVEGLNITGVDTLDDNNVRLLQASGVFERKNSLVQLQPELQLEQGVQLDVIKKYLKNDVGGFDIKSDKNEQVFAYVGELEQIHARSDDHVVRCQCQLLLGEIWDRLHFSAGALYHYALAQNLDNPVQLRTLALNLYSIASMSMRILRAQGKELELRYWRNFNIKRQSVLTAYAPEVIEHEKPLAQYFTSIAQNPSGFFARPEQVQVLLQANNVSHSTSRSNI